ncbi:MAG: vitamin K epoxide reductase family protein, partial [Pirellulaceae bacterium]
SDVPPGWSYNPSAWTQRAGIIALAFVQFFIARHLAAYQLGHIPGAWDPVFGEGTRQVLDSDVSKAFPVSDAGLGAATYLLEALTGFLGGTRRWRTMPWAVALFGVMIVPVGVVSIVLVVLQPVAVGAWCGLCLATAALTVVMIAPAVDELVATGQFLLRARRAGQPLWRTFWCGAADEGSSLDTLPTPRQPLLQELAGGMELNSIPWNLAVCVAVGMWLMAAPAVFASSSAAAANDQLAGALIVTFAAIGFGEAARGGRLVNVAIGLWLLAAPWVLTGYTPTARWNDMAVGVAVILLSLRRGRVEGKFGSWDRYVV